MCHAPFVFFSFPLQAIAQWEEDSKERELEKQRPLQDCIFISMVWCCCCGAVAAALLAILKTSFVNKNAPSVRSSMSPYLREKKTHWTKAWALHVSLRPLGWGGGCSWLEMIEWHPWARLCISWSGPHLATSHLSKWPLVCSSSWLPPFIRDGEENGSSAKKRELHESAWNN